MKKTIKTITIALFAFSTLLINSCEKNETTPKSTKGNFIFWTRVQNSNPIDIWVNNSGTINGTITMRQTSSNIPDCGASGFVTVEMEEGTYIFLAREWGANPSSWNGKFTVTAGTCRKLELY